MSSLPEIANPQRKPYASDLSDAEWEVLKPLLPAPKGFGHPVEVDFREILNAIFYVQRTGCQWEMLPHDLPPYTTVYGYFQKWQRKGIWQQIHDQVRQKLRRELGRDEHSTVAIADSQSVKTTGKKGEVYGFDGGKKVKGRKRHIVVDSQGLLIGVVVTEANAPERLGAIIVLDEAKEKLSRLEVIWVDQGYSGKNFANAVQQVCGEQVRVEVIERTSQTFEHLPKRWIVERTFGWLNRFRRLSKDYEVYSEVSEAMIYGSLLRLMVRRLAI
ncbi:IS5/IS1182 family transposase [Fischerella thermalis CCMEE 5273]|uniref:IS5 family transposase n=1 Tax=Fischerella thermalis TaxID=372787 RepID=UPI000A2F8AF2|nr:IS5 family transposase [Fischerella thermalis]PMB10595.1 IS5/IS1182 family transposase [Fischerella thermalis CCMEE 5273]